MSGGADSAAKARSPGSSRGGERPPLGIREGRRALPVWADWPVWPVWAAWMAGVVVLILLFDAWAGELSSAGRVFLGGVLVFHLVLVPALGFPSGPGRAAAEAVGLAAATLPLAEIVRGMTGGARASLAPVAAVVLLAQASGWLAGVAGRRRPEILRWVYWPLLVAVGAAMPLVAYVAVEFLGAAPWPGDGAVVAPLIRLLDAAP